jgi:hypothetical protein
MPADLHSLVFLQARKVREMEMEIMEEGRRLG